MSLSQGRPFTDNETQRIQMLLEATDLTEIVGEPRPPSACYNTWGTNRLATANERIEALEAELTKNQETIGLLLAGD